MTDEFRRTGRTTRLFEEAVRLLGELPEGCDVFITGAHTRWLKELEHDFKGSGLVDVKFYTIDQVIMGALNGRRGQLLVDDFVDLDPIKMNIVLDIQSQLLWRMRYLNSSGGN